MDFDINQFRFKFVEEATELLAEVEINLLTLESDKTNKELIQSIFRAMHTLKGVAGMYGFDAIAEYTHTAENIYDAIRDNKILLTQEIFDITFQSIDHLRNLLNDIDFLIKENQNKHSELMMRIETAISSNNISIQPYNQTKNNNKPEIKNPNEKTYYILLRADESLINRGIKILSIFSELSDLGRFKIINKTQSYLEKRNATEEYWRIFLTTQVSLNEVKNIFEFISTDCKIIKITNSNLFIPLTQFDNSHKQNDVISIFDEAERLYKLPTETESNKIKNQKNEPKTINKDTTFQSKKDKRITVDTEKLDHLMYLVSELITVNSQLVLSTKEDSYNKIHPYLEQVDKLSKQFRNNALELRLVPIKNMVLKFQRLVRDLSKKLNKKIDFNIEGTKTKFDKSTIDILAEPLMHIIRNCIDHGIETSDIRKKKNKNSKGQINFKAYHQGNNVFINIQDDGAGIDTNKIKKKAIEKGFIQANAKLNKHDIYDLIFLPGFSTAESLTQVSGRGVGMDVVRRKISDVRGEIEITSEPDIGTSITIKLQQSISILDTMLIQVADMFCMIPLADIEMCNQRSIEEIENRKHSKTIEYENKLIPFVDLKEVFDLNDSNEIKIRNSKTTASKRKSRGHNRRSIVINKQGKKMALITDRIIGEHQAVLKPLGKTFKNQELFSSASVLADGKMAFMLNTLAIQKTII